MALSDNQTAIIGRGINNPVSFSDFKANELLKLVTGEAVIQQAIFDILNTRIGERINNVEYGSNLYDLQFEPNDQILKDLLYYNVVTTLKRWEKRISITTVQIFTDDEVATQQGVANYEGGHLVAVIISYIINSTQTPGNFVYPFARSAQPTAQLTAGKESGIFGYPIIR